MTAVAADTHAALWFLESDPRLSSSARAALRQAERILLPSICLVEITYLTEKGRLQPEVPARLLAELRHPASTLTLVPLDLEITQALAHIPRQTVPDLPDRIIAATAWQCRVPLVTRDGNIQASGLETVW
jgi:PIN domain nuclease of toxin-antitoxin system